MTHFGMTVNSTDKFADQSALEAPAIFGRLMFEIALCHCSSQRNPGSADGHRVRRRDLPVRALDSGNFLGLFGVVGTTTLRSSPFGAITFFKELGQAMFSGAILGHSGLWMTFCTIVGIYAAQQSELGRLRRMSYGWMLDHATVPPIRPGSRYSRPK
ncbi:hypothetical protein [Mesorhizobium sp. M0159]|uniref:hypothetical protein n=1 Tax=Mesorhizobium sp. M0159 TaxID=2956900 RepID=UPI00333C0850